MTIQLWLSDLFFVFSGLLWCILSCSKLLLCPSTLYTCAAVPSLAQPRSQCSSFDISITAATGTRGWTCTKVATQHRLVTWLGLAIWDLWTVFVLRLASLTVVPSHSFHKCPSTADNVLCRNSTAHSNTMATRQQPLYRLLPPLVIKNKTKDEQKTRQMQRQSKQRTLKDCIKHYQAPENKVSQLWVNVSIYGWLANMFAYLPLSCFLRVRVRVRVWPLALYCSCMFMLQQPSQLRAPKENFHCVFLHYEMH